MLKLPHLSLLVQIPGPDGWGLLLEDLRYGQQQFFGTAEELLQELAARLASTPPPAGPSDVPATDTPTLRELT